MDPHSQSSNGSILKRWHVFTGLFLILLPSAKIVFFAGGADARTEEQLSSLRSEVSKIETEYARKEVIDQRLANIEKSQQRVEDQVKDQNKLLEELLTDARSRRRQ